MINPNEVEKFLIHKYSVNVLTYKGFRYVRDLIVNNSDYIMGRTLQELKIVADTYDVKWTSVERAIRHLISIVSNDRDSVTVFINNLIFEFKEYQKDRKNNG